MSVWFILAIILAVIGVLIFFAGRKMPREVETGRNDYGFKTTETVRGNPAVTGLGLVLVGVALVFTLISSVYSQSVGQSVVLVNAGGSIAGVDNTNGVGFKAPWQKAVKWDLFTRDITYDNAHEGSAAYENGEIKGTAVTSSVARGAQTTFDLNVTYNVKAEDVLDLYTKYRDQNRFTRQVVEPAILSAARTVPTKYDPVVFRGEKRDASATEILEAANKRLAGYGVEVTLVNIQDIRFSEQVEESIKQVEVAQQKEAEAQANLRAAEVDAQKQVAQAKAEAEANRLLTESLTPEVLKSKELETLRAIGEKGNMVITGGGSTPLVQIPTK